ncbi:MAG: ABC transporter ATP-binding protein [Actinomycetota bacterium]
MNDPVIRFVDTERTFGDVTALARLSLEMPTNAISVILGPNGAGKTTAMRLITGALPPSGGAVEVFGLTPTSADGEEVRRRCGVVTAKPSLYDRLTGRDNLGYAAELFGLGRGAVAEARIADASARFGIVDALDQQVGGYSTGMKTRLALARSILHDPELLLLDEPTSGLDPESAAAVLELIKAMTADGRSVVLCTHLLSEAEGLADLVVVMEGGRLMVSGRPVELAERHWPKPVVRFTAAGPYELDCMTAWPEVLAYERTANVATVTVTDNAAIPDLVTRLCAGGARLLAVDPYRPTLEDLYFAERRVANERAALEAAAAVVNGTDDGSSPDRGLATVSAP